MPYYVREQADGNGSSGFYVYNDEKYIAGPRFEGCQATNYIETLTDGRYIAKADRTTVMRGRRSNGKLVLREKRDHQPHLLAPRPLGESLIPGRPSHRLAIPNHN
ncbi:hypothetical protein NKH49_26240 [Mesorhizobium sp. M1088]|uniref:hypothetical protein n=1 Tax=Mesorhizobium sp. M1088 TaxID=2957056 RepID=UPI00333A6BC9